MEHSKEFQNLDRDELIVAARKLLAETQAMSVRISAVNEIATAINRSLKLDEILRVVGKQAKWLLDFNHLSVYLVKSDVNQFIQLSGSSIEFEESQIAANSSFRKAVRTGQSLLIKKANSDDFLHQFPSQIILPLENNKQIFGAIIFGSIKLNAYSQEDLRIGYLLSLQLSSAIRNAYIYEDLNNLYVDLNNLYVEVEMEKEKSERLLLNILPAQIAEELKSTGKVRPVYHESASILFTDFENFTQLASLMSPEELVNELDYCFSGFDQIIESHNLEKLKTIGDSYMCGGGIPNPSPSHAIDTVFAAIKIQKFMELRKQEKLLQNQPYWNVRIGIHSGSMLSGVIGRKKFVYDVWGDTVNLASRMESSGVAGKVNISQATYELVKDYVDITYRGKVLAKNVGEIDMYLVEGIK